MRNRLLRAMASTLGARVASALLSFLVFAQVAAALPPSFGARVLFFSFAFGFVLASFRTFHVVAAAVTGGESRAARLRHLRAPARTLSWLPVLLAPLTGALFLSQGVSGPVVLAAVMLTWCCAHDLDLLRAVAGRTPVLPWLTAAGGVLGAVLLLASSAPTAEVCAWAFLLQWVPVAGYHLLHGRRLLRGSRTAQAAKTSPAPHRRLTVSALLLSVFDGAVLNAPFILGLPLAASAAFDLALGSRLFVASLALFSLVGSWVVSGDLHRLAQRLRMPNAWAFAGLQFAAAAVLGLVYAALYAGVAGRAVSAVALIIFMVTLAAYTVHATAVRFGIAGASTRGRLLAYGAALPAFYAVMGWQRSTDPASLWLVVAAVVAALVVPAGLLALLRRAQRMP